LEKDFVGHLEESSKTKTRNLGQGKCDVKAELGTQTS